MPFCVGDLATVRKKDSGDGEGADGQQLSQHKWKGARSIGLAHQLNQQFIELCWELSLDAPGAALTGGFACGAGYYETSVLCADLTDDGGEEIILSVMPRDGGGMGGELHVFTARNNALEEILTVCDGDPAEAQAKYAASYFVAPDGFTYADGEQAYGFGGVYTRATGISTAGFKLLRVTAERDGISAQTYLWWNGDSFEIVWQKAIK